MTTLEKLKLDVVIWESDTDQAGYQHWADNMQAFVRTLLQGDQLEDMLDAKLGRHRARKANIPSYILNDLDFASMTAEYRDTESAGQSAAGSRCRWGDRPRWRDREPGRPGLLT